MTTFNEYRTSNILNTDGTVNYYGKILSSEEANRYFDLLMQNTQWEKDEVIIFGKDLPINKLAEWGKTIPYELMTSVSQRVKRVYYEE